MYVASMDDKTAFDVSRPRHIAKVMNGQDAHGWFVAALLREMKNLQEREREPISNMWNALSLA